MSTDGIALGLQIVPTMGSDELIDIVVLAEELGYSYCMVADEGLMLDVYAVLGAAARATSTIRLGPVTNPYTRHPAATAAAVATIDEMSGGRAFVTLVAGGTMVLHPMGIERTARPVHDGRHHRGAAAAVARRASHLAGTTALAGGRPTGHRQPLDPGVGSRPGAPRCWPWPAPTPTVWC